MYKCIYSFLHSFFMLFYRNRRDFSHVMLYECTTTKTHTRVSRWEWKIWALWRFFVAIEMWKILSALKCASCEEIDERKILRNLRSSIYFLENLSKIEFHMQKIYSFEISFPFFFWQLKSESTKNSFQLYLLGKHSNAFKLRSKWKKIVEVLNNSNIRRHALHISSSYQNIFK